jgi:hypothetical protein
MTDEELILRHIQRIAYGIATPLVEVKPKPVVVTIRHVEPRPLEHLECAPPNVTLH